MPALVASYDIQPGNGEGAFWEGMEKQKIDKSSKKGKREKVKNKVDGGKWRYKEGRGVARSPHGAG